MNEDRDDDLSSLLRTSSFSKRPSHNPLEKIKKALVTNMIWAVIICIMYIAVIIYFHYWQVQLSIGIVLVSSLWALYTAYQQYKQIDSNVSAANPVLTELKRHHESITRWMNTQQRVFLFIYPVSTLGGFMLGGVLGSGKSVEYFMSKPFVQWALLICIVVMVPAAYYLAKWMFNYSFGKHLKALNENIKALEEEK